MIKEAIAQLVEKKNLSPELMRQAMQELISGEATYAQIAGFLVGLRLKGETVAEITAACEIMRGCATKIKSSQKILLDTCGTGGDMAGTFNISTLSALVAAGCGVALAKHGNRSVSSKCGSADLLIELGVKIDIEAEKVAQCLDECGFAFLYAPLLHQAMKYATPVRRELGVRTIFNILGPLVNPAGARYQLLGVYKAELTEVLAQVLKNLGSQHVLVVHGEDGLDEVTTTGKTIVSELTAGRIKTYKIAPADFGIKQAKVSELKGGDPAFNAQLAYSILKGAKGPQRDIVLLNAGCAIYAAEQVSSIKEGVARAAQCVDSGDALKKLELLRHFTNK